MKKTAFVFALLVFGCLLTSFQSPPVYIVGDKADDFSLQNVDGTMVSLSSFPNAKGFIVVFTCNHCPYAQLYEQRVINLHKKFAAQGFPVIAINPNSPEVVPEDSFEEMQNRAKTKRYPFPYLFDEKQEVYPLFGATRTPHVFVLDKDRYVRYIGAIDDNAESAGSVKKRYVEDAVNALLREEAPFVDFTRAIGCTIKKKPAAK